VMMRLLVSRALRKTSFIVECVDGNDRFSRMARSLTWTSELGVLCRLAKGY